MSCHLPHCRWKQTSRGCRRFAERSEAVVCMLWLTAACRSIVNPAQWRFEHVCEVAAVVSGGSRSGAGGRGSHRGFRHRGMPPRSCGRQVRSSQRRSSDRQFVRRDRGASEGQHGAGRYLDRRKGDGGYMVILDTDELDRWQKHVNAIGVRVAAHLASEGYRGLQLHPATQAVLFSKSIGRTEARTATVPEPRRATKMIGPFGIDIKGGARSYQ